MKEQKKRFFNGIETPFAQQVYAVVARIPKGSVLTYKEVAQRAGSARAARAVGNILHRNRDVRVPCHRVVCTDGRPGGYAWGSAKKKALLKKEGAVL